VALRVRAGSAPRGPVGKIFTTLFFGVFLGLGSWFAWLVAAGFVRAASTYAWPESRCSIDASGVEERPGAGDEAYVFRVRYHYAAGGARYTSVRYRFGYSGGSDVAAAQRLTLRYPPGAETPCYVDPDDPTEATLERPNLWTGLMVLFPLIFVAVGGGGIAYTWWPRRKRRRAAGGGAPDAAPPVEAISGAAKRPALAGGCLAGFFSLFLLFGLGFFIPFFGVPLWRSVAARSWPAVPCTILHSEVRSHAGDDGTTYSVDVLFSYRVEGREFKSSRFRFIGGSSSGYEGKAAAVERYPPGTETVCYVNPQDPTDAVVERDLGGDAWFGLIPLVFVAVGAGGMVFALVSARRKRVAAAAEWLPAPQVAGGPVAAIGPGSPAPAAAAAIGGPVTLEPGTGPVGKFVGLTLAALFWNGIVGVFAWKVVEGYRQGSPDGCLTLFLVPFVLVGLLLAASVPYQFLALFNPRPALTLGTAAPRLGEPTTLAWRFRGAAGRIRRLRIVLEGREEATYTRGTRTSTDQQVFATLELVDAADRPRIAAGSATFTVPADTMHSFAADHNTIVWKLKVAGEIRLWPDVDQQFPLVVRPQAVPGGGGTP
jgi:hypothetical protein